MRVRAQRDRRTRVFRVPVRFVDNNECQNEKKRVASAPDKQQLEYIVLRRAIVIECRRFRDVFRHVGRAEKYFEIKGVLSAAGEEG